MELISSPRSLLPHAQLVLQRQPGPGFRRVSLQKITEFLLFLTETATAVAWVPGPPGRRRKGSGKKALNPHFLPPSLSFFFFLGGGGWGLKWEETGSLDVSVGAVSSVSGPAVAAPVRLRGGARSPSPGPPGAAPPPGRQRSPSPFFSRPPNPLLFPSVSVVWLDAEALGTVVAAVAFLVSVCSLPSRSG